MKDYKVDKESFSDSFRKEVYEVISQIPVGKVSTYGGIALLLGVPQCSRMVGRALKEGCWFPAIELSIPPEGWCPDGWNKNNSCWQKELLSRLTDVLI